jgi:uncharacterized protein (DUF885 family)
MNLVRLAAAGILLAFAIGTVPMRAQDGTAAPQKSIAELAAQAKTNKTVHAKIRLDDDSDDVKKSPIPDISSSDFADNSDEIARAIIDYRTTHSAKETEEVLHTWYDKYDTQLSRALDDNRRINARQSQNAYADAYAGARNMRDYQEAMASYQRSTMDDYQRRTQNYALSGRIRGAFTKVRNQIRPKGMDFDWFVIRDGN